MDGSSSQQPSLITTPTEAPTETSSTPSSPSPSSLSWLDNMPNDIRESKTLTKFKDVENLARGYINAEQLLGRDKIPMPKTDAEFAEVYAKLGCPADIAEYTVAVDEEKTPEAIRALVKDDLKKFLPKAKELGLNNAQAANLFNWYVENASSSVTSNEAKISSEMAMATASLKTEFGEAYETKIALANRALSKYADSNLINSITNSGLGRNPSFIKMMVKLGEEHAEELGIDKSGTAGVMTPNELNSQIAELQSHPAYFDSKHPEHKSVVARVHDLYTRKTRK